MREKRAHLTYDCWRGLSCLSSLVIYIYCLHFQLLLSCSYISLFTRNLHFSFLLQWRLSAHLHGHIYFRVLPFGGVVSASLCYIFIFLCDKIDKIAREKLFYSFQGQHDQTRNKTQNNKINKNQLFLWNLNGLKWDARWQRRARDATKCLHIYKFKISFYSFKSG